MPTPPPATLVVDDPPSVDDRAAVAALLDREPKGAYRIVVRHEADGSPVVIRNEPLLDDGRPMPTTFWLLGEPERTMVSRLESRGGVHRVESIVGMEAIAAAHDRYRAEREAELPEGWTGPRPTGGVGGTRVGIKCLHAHYAWFLAGGDDPVGAWVADRLAAGDGDREGSDHG
ncbi:MAG TPA: DUF501 domain-containing protein [Aquihabitans sp.]|nr:DUF501 domain-containing protein [Aquihabitans sp.]